MYSDSALGTLDWVEYVLFEQILTGTGTQVYPLIVNSLQRQPMFSFAQSTQQGPIDRPSIDPRLSYVSLLNDLTGGVGYQQVAPTDDLTRYYWGSLETRFKGYVTLPQQVKTTATLPAFPGVSAGKNVRCRVATTSNGQRMLYVLGAVNGATDQAFAYNLTTAPASGTSIALRLMDVADFNGQIVATRELTPNGIYTSTDGTTFTVRESTQWWAGLAAHDNKLWSFNRTNNTLYACVDPTQGLYVAPSTNPNGWRAMSDVLLLLPGESPYSLVEWRDNQGQQALYLVTSHRLIGFDDESGEWAPYAGWRDLGTPGLFPSFVVWPRDRQLYGIPGTQDSTETARFVFQFTGTQSEVGPAHSGQLPPAYAGRALWLAANAHHVLLWHHQDNVASPNQGVLAYNEQGGWHPVFTGPTSKHIVGGTYDRGSLVVVYHDGSLDIVDLPDSATPTIILNSKGQATSGSITLAETECGAPGVYKLGAYLYVDARKPDNTYGLPANNTLRLGTYLYDGTIHSSAIDLTAASTFPAIIPLPDNDATLQTGLPFRRFKLQPLLQKAAVTDDSARIMDIGLYYDLWREQRYAYQFAIDFTDAAWGYPTSGTDGVTREQAIANLLALQDTKQRFKVTFGAANGQQIIIPAAEILVASRTDMNQHGVWPVTIRDVSAPASG